MRQLAALVVIASLGCGADPPSADAGTCGEPPPGLAYFGFDCTLACPLVDGSLVNRPCFPDGGVPFCSSLGDVHNCGACGNDCTTGLCAPAGGATYTAACEHAQCRCTRQ